MDKKSGPCIIIAMAIMTPLKSGEDEEWVLRPTASVALTGAFVQSACKIAVGTFFDGYLLAAPGLLLLHCSKYNTLCGLSLFRPDRCLSADRYGRD